MTNTDSGPAAADVDRSSKEDSSHGPSSIHRAVGTFASMMLPDSEVLTTGDLADLRRLDPDRPYAPALWRMLVHARLETAPPPYSQDVWERNWATLLMGLAHCRGLHDYDTPLGAALALAGWSELRFSRLLLARDGQLAASIRPMAQFLASKPQSTNWAHVADLLFIQSGPPAEKARVRTARSYYGTLYKHRKNAEQKNE